MTLPDAGWYTDPADTSRVRWWDGSAWTESVRETPASTSSPAGSAWASTSASGGDAQPAMASAQRAGDHPQPAGASQPAAPGHFGPPAHPATPGNPLMSGYPSAPGYPPASGLPSAPGYPPAFGLPSVPGYPPVPDHPSASAVPAAPGAPSPAASGYPSGYPGWTGPADPGVPRVGPVKAVTTPDGVPLASLGSRLGARVIDWFLLTALTTVPVLPFLLRFLHNMVQYLDRTRQALDSGQTVNPLGIYTDTGFIPFVIAVSVVSLLISAAYTVPLLHLRGGTPGKLMLGVRVRPWDADGRPTWAQAWQRWLSGELAGAVIGFYALLDDLWPLWDDRRQAVHDKWPGTVVVTSHR